ncbi:MAG: hypothetical protein KAT04_00580 [Methylococcales bacterium]|nr:hypothetical protein [Methylococcales bacterium]
MDKELAEYAVKVAFKSESDLNDLIPLLKEHCSENEYKKLAIAIATVASTINTEILNHIYDAHPEIRDDVDRKINEYGRLI